jgi:hypothetical protein
MVLACHDSLDSGRSQMYQHSLFLSAGFFRQNHGRDRIMGDVWEKVRRLPGCLIGLNYFEKGKWLESEERIDFLDNFGFRVGPEQVSGGQFLVDVGNGKVRPWKRFLPSVIHSNRSSMGLMIHERSSDCGLRM